MRLTVISKNILLVVFLSFISLWVSREVFAENDSGYGCSKDGCPGNLICNRATDQCESPRSTSRPECTYNNDCDNNELCTGGRCVTQSTPAPTAARYDSYAACLSDQKCSSGDTDCNDFCSEFGTPGTATRPGSSSTDKNTESGEVPASASRSGNACPRAATLTSIECSGFGLGGAAAAANQMRAGRAMSTADTELAQCEALEKAGKAAQTGAILATGTCGAAYAACKIACRGPGNERYSQDCDVAVMGAASARMQNFAQASDVQQQAAYCKKLLAEKDCEKNPKAEDMPHCTEKYCKKHGKKVAAQPFCNKCAINVGAEDDPDCPQYCSNPKHFTKPKCAIALPSPPQVPGLTNPSVAGNQGKLTSDLPPYNPEDTDPLNLGAGGDGGDYAGQENKGSAKFDSNDGGGGGGALGSMGGYPGGASGGAGKDQGAHKTDIEKGYSGGSGGGYSVSGVPFGGGGGGAGGKGDDKLDLSKFLPGGALDPAKQRDPTGENAALGITGANDLSNWEKITRMMNKKRPLLVQ